MKTFWIVATSAVVVILLIIRMIKVQMDRQDDQRQEFVSKLNYHFSATVDSIALFNPNAPVGYIYLGSPTDSVTSREKKISRLVKEGQRMRFLDAAKRNRLRMFSKDARLYKIGDSLYINTAEDRMRLFHGDSLVREFRISEQVR